MTREEIYGLCLNKIAKSNCLLIELPTGFGKSLLSIQLINHLCDTVYKGKETSMLLLVAKTIHKQTWKDEFEKWGGTKVDKVVIECYESLKKHTSESFTFIVADEVHHIKSDARLDLLSTIHFDYMLGLSATVPKNLKLYFKHKYNNQTVSCNIVDAIESEVLPEPEIILYPLVLNNKDNTEVIEINPKAKGPVVEDIYRNLWKYKKQKVHAIISCTQKQKSNELSSLILWEKNRYMATRNEIMKNKWLQDCGKRLEFYANCKNDVVKAILNKLKKQRTITFCKTIEQCEELGKNCIHSKNNQATEIYDKFNQKELNHITAVNILNENANLVDCKYAIFANLSSSEVISCQRIGRSLRHKSPVIIIPYYENTREQEIVEKMIEGYDRKYIRIIHSITEL